MGMTVHMRVAVRVLMGIVHLEAPPGQHLVAVRDEPALDLGRQASGALRGENVLFEFRKRVDRSGQEHVAGHAADRVEVDVERGRHAGLESRDGEKHGLGTQRRRRSLSPALCIGLLSAQLSNSAEDFPDLPHVPCPLLQAWAFSCIVPSIGYSVPLASNFMACGSPTISNCEGFAFTWASSGSDT